MHVFTFNIKFDPDESIKKNFPRLVRKNLNAPSYDCD